MKPTFSLLAVTALVSLATLTSAQTQPDRLQVETFMIHLRAVQTELQENLETATMPGNSVKAFGSYDPETRTAGHLVLHTNGPLRSSSWGLSERTRLAFRRFQRAAQQDPTIHAAYSAVPAARILVERLRSLEAYEVPDAFRPTEEHFHTAHETTVLLLGEALRYSQAVMSRLQEFERGLLSSNEAGPAVREANSGTGLFGT